MRVFGRWLLYSLAGLLLLAMLFGGGDAFGEDPKKGRWRSILLSIGGALAGLAGGFAYYVYRSGGQNHYWPASGAIAWTLAAGLTIGAWFSIASDIRHNR